MVEVEGSGEVGVGKGGGGREWRGGARMISGRIFRRGQCDVVISGQCSYYHL